MPSDAPPRPLLIAYDGSENAKHAIAVAGEQIGDGRKAIVLTVFEPLDKVPFFSAAGVPVQADTMNELYSGARSAAQAAAEEGADLARDAGFDAEALASDGAPVWNQIVEVAEDRDVGLIVIGSRGLSGIKHAVLGSVAGAVAQHSKRSVLIVHNR